MLFSTKKILEAYNFAYTRHKGQFRKFVKIEYIAHPTWVANFVYAKTGSQNMAVAALLHDVPEDTTETLPDMAALFEEIRTFFGLRVMHLVSEMTTNEDEMKYKGKPIYLANKMLEMSFDALTLKLSDRLHNVMGLDDDRVPVNFVVRYTAETRFIINRMKFGRPLNDLHREIIGLIEFILFHVQCCRLGDQIHAM